MSSCTPSKPAASPVMTLTASTAQRKVALPRLHEKPSRTWDERLLAVDTNCES